MTYMNLAGTFMQDALEALEMIDLYEESDQANDTHEALIKALEVAMALNNQLKEQLKNEIPQITGRD